MLELPRISLALLFGVGLVAACGSSAAVKPSGSSGDGGDGMEPTGPSTGSGGFAASGTGGLSSSGGGSNGGAEPPPPGPLNPGTGSGVVLAMSKLYMGDTDRDGTPNKANGWKQYGFDIDHTISTKLSTDLCKPAEMAAPGSVSLDGNDGIDNSFGENILPLLLGLESDYSTKINASIAAGLRTTIVAIGELGAGTDYNPLLSKLYWGANLGAAPKFDGTDAWPLVYELLNNGDKTNPKIQFPQSYVTAGTWVSGPPQPIEISLSVFGQTTVFINQGVITMDLSPDDKSAKNGTISGVMNTEQLIASIKLVAGSFDKGLCTVTTFDSIANEIRMASDIMSDGTQDPTKICDGISIGLGFDALPVQLGPAAPPVQPMPDPCGP